MQLVKDVIIVMVPVFIGGVIVGLLYMDAAVLPVWAIGLSNFVGLLLGFGFIAHRTPGDPGKHLCLVAVIIWLLGLSNVALGGSVVSWLLSAIVIAIACGIGAIYSLVLSPAADAADT